MTAHEGQLIGGDFKVVRPLSSGGMGAVYVAEQLSTGSRRALKLMHPDLVSDQRLRERFTQEARVSSQIASDHVVSIVAAGVDADSGAPFIAMELLEGETLRDRIDRQGPLPKSLALTVFQQLFHAVGAAHDASIVHRDLKPENVFLARARRADSGFSLKILDFGIAKLLADARTQRTAAMGTPLWMAPEQTESDRPITRAADLWALGLIAFYVLVGKPFWRSAAREASVHAVMREILFEELPRASARALELGGPTLPPSFDDFFARTVCRDVEARFATAGDALDALQRALASLAEESPSKGESGGELPAWDATVPADPMGGRTEPIQTPPSVVVRPVPTPPRHVSRTPLYILGGLVAVGALGWGMGPGPWGHPDTSAARAPDGPIPSIPIAHGTSGGVPSAATAPLSSTVTPSELLRIAGSDPRRGLERARVTVIWYADHGCPDCVAVSPTMDALFDNYPTDVRLVWRDCALQSEGRVQSIAARAAFITGGSPTFWKAHDWMIENPRLSSLTLDPRTVLESIGAGITTQSTIEDATTQINALDRCRATTGGRIPTFFVNGERVTGAQPIGTFADAVERHIKSMNTLLDTGTDHDVAYVADVRASYRPASP